VSNLTAPAPAPAIPGGALSMGALSPGMPTDGRAIPTPIAPGRGVLAELGHAIRDELGQALVRFERLQRDATDELLLWGLLNPNRRDELLELLQLELERAALSIRLARRMPAEVDG
jgi:hypothetical protein